MYILYNLKTKGFETINTVALGCNPVSKKASYQNHSSASFSELNHSSSSFLEILKMDRHVDIKRNSRTLEQKLENKLHIGKSSVNTDRNI